MGYNHLNTIEEEKHETQTSNYFRDAGGDVSGDDVMNHTNAMMRGSKILDDLSSSKVTPGKGGQDSDEYEEDEDDENEKSIGEMKSVESKK